MSAPKKDRDHKAGLVPGSHDKDRTPIACLAGKPKVAAFIELSTGGLVSVRSTSSTLIR
jgi:hypothetical protein